MRSVATRARTAFALGIGDIATVLAYRALTRAASVAFPRPAIRNARRGEFFNSAKTGSDSFSTEDRRIDELLLFGAHPVAIEGSAPHWFRNPLTGVDFPEPQRPWYSISDFGEGVGDIKAVWELSRFDWALPLARRYLANDPSALRILNQWLDDWDLRNPSYQGPNWKCGQEASLRVLNLAATALALRETDTATPRFLDFLQSHAERIRSTMRYAVAQRNNHATSEAAALFVAGAWLQRYGERNGNAFKREGRESLERNIDLLVSPSGAFSQYSVTYHRLLLDTCSVVELTRRAFGASPLSSHCVGRLSAATDWLERLVDSHTGDAPNIGANDGARILHATNSPYRDFRPTVQLASALFRGSLSYCGPGGYDEAFDLFGLRRPSSCAPPTKSAGDDDGGFAVLRNARALAVLRYPRFRFRPSHADALHVDLWVDGVNLLRDSGTYSYNQDTTLYEYLASVRAHNTVQFDDRDQMPRLGRFLYGNWLTSERVLFRADGQEGGVAAAAYRDDHAAVHERRIELGLARLRVTDCVSGFKRNAKLRWRLPPADWVLERTSAGIKLLRQDGAGTATFATIRSTANISAVGLNEGWESTHYLQKSTVRVLELVLSDGGTIETSFCWT
jgi:hypothetical protein